MSGKRDGWGELCGDDLDMGETGMELRQEQVGRNSEQDKGMRSEAICKAEKLERRDGE